MHTPFATIPAFPVTFAATFPTKCVLVIVDNPVKVVFKLMLLFAAIMMLVPELYVVSLPAVAANSCAPVIS